MYGASVTLGVGGSTLLVTVLTMLADLIGDNVVRVLSRDSCFVLPLFTFCSGRLNAGFHALFANETVESTGTCTGLRLNIVRRIARLRGCRSQENEKSP